MADNRLEYEKRVNRVVDHVAAHLAEDLSLARLARVAAFSPFHFHRVFRAITGETLAGFIQRLRIEKSAAALSLHPDLSVLEIALDHGFASAATFARAFRVRFGMSATQWRRGGAQRWRRRRESKPGKPIRKPGKASSRAGRHTPRKRSEEARMTIRVRDLPAYHLAYMRHVGPYGDHGIPALWARFRVWMEARGLPVAETVRIGIGHDEPAITAPARCRYDACAVVPADFAADRRVNLMDLPAGRYAVATFTGGPHEIEGAWARVFAAWLPASGFQPDDRPCLEIYTGPPAAPGAFRCDLCLPVRPL